MGFDAGNPNLMVGAGPKIPGLEMLRLGVNGSWLDYSLLHKPRHSYCLHEPPRFLELDLQSDFVLKPAYKTAHQKRFRIQGYIILPPHVLFWTGWGMSKAGVESGSGSDSEVKVVFDETANLKISTSGKDESDKGYGTSSLLEQWSDSYTDNADYDPYNDDMYENHDLSEHLQSICDDLDITDVKTMFEAIQARFGGDDATNKTQRKLLKQMYENFNAPSTESLDSIFYMLQKIVSRNKADLDTMNIDDLYNNFKIVEQEVKRTVTSSSGFQNMAFLISFGSTNEVDIAIIQVSTVGTPVSTVSSHDNTANLSDAIVYAFLANQPNGSQLVHEDQEQIYEDDLEKMDLKWQLALLSVRTKSSRKTVNVEDTSSKAMVAIDGEGFDWSCMADDEVPTNMALMAFSDSEEFQHTEFKGYGPKDSKGVCVDTSNEIKKAPDAPIIEDWVFDSDDDECEEMEHDEGYIAFRGGAKGGKITGKGTIKTGKLDFEDVYFVKELQFNLFSVSQMCDKKNNVLFTDTECFVLSSNFKLADESQVLLKVPRKNNMYCFDMKNIVPQKDLTCLLAKATNNESMLWHRRLVHINFKSINKLFKDNLVRGLPSKHFKNNQNCVACLKGKQHKVSFKSKTQNSISQSLFMLHMDLFGLSSRRNRTLIEAVRTMLADSKLPTTFWAEAVNTTCYVQNRVLLVKPHFKTLYKLFKGRSPYLNFMRPFGCHVTILNTLDQLRMFDGKSDKGIFVGYSTISKDFRVYNTRTRKVKENLHITFLENKPMIAGGGPEWLFDIDSLSKSMNYAPAPADTNSNDFAGKRTSFDAGQSSMETRPCQDYILMPLWKERSLFDSSSQASDGPKKDKHGPSQASESDNKERPNAKSSTKTIKTTGPVNTATPTYMEPKKVTQASDDESWVEAMQKELLQFKLLNEVYVSQPPSFVDPEFPDRVYKVEKALYGLHQAHRACVKSASTPMETQKPLSKDANGTDVDVHLYSDYASASLDRKCTTGGSKIHVDNKSAICAVKNHVYHSKTKHIEIRHYFIRDSYEKRLIEMVKIHTDYNVADLLTKAFDVTMFQFLIASIGLKLKGYLINDGYADLVQHFWNTASFKTINFVKKIHAIVDGKAVVISESSVRSDLLFKDEDGITCLTNDAIFENLALMGYEPLSTKLTFQKGLRGCLNNPMNHLSQKVTHLEMGRDYCTTYTQDSPLIGGYTSGSDEGRLKLEELMDLCTTLSNKVFTLENKLFSTKVVYHKAFITLTKTVKKLETQLKQKRSKAVIHSSDVEEPSVHIEDSPKQERMIKELDKDEDVNLFSQQGEVQETVEPLKGDDANLTKTLLNIKRTQKLYDEELAKETARQEQEKYNLEKALELQRQLDKREKDVDKGDQAKETDWNDPTVLRYHALQNRPFSKAKVRKTMVMYLKNQEGYKQSYFKGMKYEDIRPILWDQVHAFVPKDLEIKKEVMKRSGFHLQQESSKKQKLDQQTEEKEEKVEAQADSDQEVEEMELYMRIVPN
uniref:Ribonuclease H-like domain-containing protein n=1 Tax=Tanacetum cinerariifolium TaxID=118510 RepID=A0A6L2L3L2_TANCI|nr:ribonuclease H-like domain-containing protein [Tanacetum cinerariifolium]